jgi:deoxyribodipyrimidine photolyase-related protein
MLLAYESLGGEMRSSNRFGFTRPMPEAFYTGDTGLEPVDEIIRRVLRYGYAHHIERLMFLGNPMLLCEINPDEVYRWFMELFIDAYDWVMVPNVYGMSQFADGGLITTKPYVSSSNYIRKMSPWKKGNWARVWDALFWRFVYRHRELFENNPRMSMMARQLEKMGEEKLASHLDLAEGYLEALHKEGRPADFVATVGNG